MFKKIKNLTVFALLAVSIFTVSGDLYAYTKKAPYAGYGKISSTTGRPKTKIVRSHTKRTSKGYTYVNPYARSR